MRGLAVIAVIARHRRNRKSKSLPLMNADQEEIVKTAEIAKDRRKEELTAKDAKERKGTRSRGSMQSFDD